MCSDELTLETKVRQCHSSLVRLFPSLLHHFQPLLAPVMRLVRHEGHKTTHTHKPGVLSPLTETPAHVLNWSMACRNWSLGVSFSSAPSLASRSCRVVRSLHPWDTEHFSPSFLQTRTAERVYFEVEFDTFSSPNCVVYTMYR